MWIGRFPLAGFGAIGRSSLKLTHPGWSETSRYRSRHMKQDTHPDYHFITVQMTAGTSFKTRSTWGKEGDTLTLDINPTSHPPWTGGHQRLLYAGGRVARFTHLFGGITLPLGRTSA